MVSFLTKDKELQSYIESQLRQLKDSGKLSENEYKGAYSAMTACINYREADYHYQMFAQRYGVET